jgi:iron complex outermembrane receptor protein
MSKPTRLFRSFSTAVIAVASFVTAHAQTAATGPVVNAQKVVVEETRLSSDAAGATQVRIDATVPTMSRSLENLGARVANLHVNSGGARSFGDIFTLRGLSNTPFFSDPAVTLYFDDLPLASSFTYPTALFGFTDAAVHRGPQGTVFGRAGEGGVIVLNSTEPDTRPGAELRLGAGNYQARSAALTARSGRGETADASLSFAYGERDGYIANTQLGTRVDDQQAYSGAARVRVRPSTTSEITLQLLGTRSRDGAQPLVPLGGPLFTVARGREGQTDMNHFGAAIKAVVDLSGARLTAITSYTDWKLDPYDNRLVLPPPLDSRIVQTQRTWNEEVHLASDRRADLTWNTGLWLSDGRTVGDVNRAIPGLFPIEISNSRLKSKTGALFGQFTYAATSQWKITAGARLEETKKDFRRGERVPAVGQFDASSEFDAFLPKIAVAYAVNPDTNASLSLSFGTKPGGWSAFTGNAALAPFRAEKTAALEAGIDTATTDKTVQLAARVFGYAIRDYQIERSFTATDYLVVNAPRARAIGGEIEATWRPNPEWTFAATFGTTKITLRKFVDPFSGRSFAGNRAPYTPAYDGHLSATYRLSSGWFVGGELVAIGRTYYDEAETARFSQSARTLVNARAGYDTARWRVTLFGDNLTDKGYYSLIIPGVGHGAPGAPITYGAEAAVKF